METRSKTPVLVAPTDIPIDWGAPVRTLEGNPARVVCTDYKGSDGRCEHPILAVITYPEGLEVIGAYTREGEHHLCYTGEMDLINRAEEEAGFPPTDTRPSWLRPAPPPTRPAALILSGAACHHAAPDRGCSPRRR